MALATFRSSGNSGATQVQKAYKMMHESRHKMSLWPIVILLIISVARISAMLDTSMSCSDNECPPDKECFVPSCYGSSCRSVQPICLEVLDATDSPMGVDGIYSPENGLKVEYNFVNPEELRLRL